MFNFNKKTPNPSDEAVQQLIVEAFERYYDDVYRYVAFKVNDQDVAEEIASETFIRLVDALNKGKDPGERIKGWLFVTASHIIGDHYRSHYKKQETAMAEEFSDSKVDLQKEVESNETRTLLGRNLEKLTQEQRDVLNYRFNMEYSIEETAALMDKNENAIKQLQFRALSALKKLMNDEI